MRWKQFLSHGKTMTAREAKNFMEAHNEGRYVLLDVRQPGEYRAGHIPGAQLIPLPQLPSRMDEVEKGKPVIVYCAVGGRSKIAAQMLSAKGLDPVYNLTGGMTAWHGGKVPGDLDEGMTTITGNESENDLVLFAYGMEEGLSGFYYFQKDATQNVEAQKLFTELFQVEEKHKIHLKEQFPKVLGSNLSETLATIMEGGLTTDEFLTRYRERMATKEGIVDMAMELEAQALDLYMRIARKMKDPKSKNIALLMADEEKKHLEKLGNYRERIA